MTFFARIAGVSATAFGLLLGSAGLANAGVYKYSATVTLCTGTCASFASLDIGTQITGTLEVNTGPDGSWTNADITAFSYEVFNPMAPAEPFNGLNPATANPLPLSIDIAPIRDLGGVPLGSVATAGTADANGDFDDGDMFHQFIVPPFNSNSAWVIFDLAAGSGKVCLFYSTAGCIPGATESVNFTGTFTRLDDVRLTGLSDMNANGAGELVWASTDFSTPPQATVIDVDQPGTPIAAFPVAASAAVVPEMTAGFRYEPVTRGLSFPGIATLNVNYADGGTNWVYLTDAGDGTVLGKAPFLSSGARTIDMSADLTGSSPTAPRIGLLMQDKASGKPRVHTRDFANNARTTNQFFNGSWDPVGMVTFPNLDGPGETTIGVVATAQSNGRIRMDVINVDGGGGVRQYNLKNTNWSAVDVTAFRHSPGGPGGTWGAAVLTTNAAGRIDAAIVEIGQVAEGGGALPASINFLSADYVPVAIATVSDYNGTTGVDALAVLGRHRLAGTARVQVKDATTGVLVSTADYLPGVYDHLQLVVVPDANGNGSPEIGVLGTDAALATRAQFQDSLTGAFVRHIFAP